MNKSAAEIAQMRECKKEKLYSETENILFS